MNPKKKIAVVFCRMTVGGAEKALFNFLNEIDRSAYAVTLFTHDPESVYLKNIPRNVRIASVACVDSREQLRSDLRRFHLLRALKGLFCRAMIRICKNSYYEYMWTQLSYPKITERYDCAIAYKMNFEDTATTIFRIKAKKKCAVMHSNITAEKSKTDRFVLLLLLLLDAIFCVSEANEVELNKAYPLYAKKTRVMRNIIYRDEIVGKGNCPIMEAMGGLTLCTVGRLHEFKGQQMVPKTARLLLDAGYDVTWYLVGDGPLRGEVEAEIGKYGVQDRVILLGTKENPYPYIKNCTIYVQPSFTEGYCTTTMEAKILQKPIVTTDAPGMREQFVSGENGLIVDAMTPEALFEGIRRLLDHPELRRRFIDNLSHETFDNAGELQKLYDFIES